MSAIFEDECTRLTVSLRTAIRILVRLNQLRHLCFVQLKPFANVVFSQGGDQITF